MVLSLVLYAVGILIFLLLAIIYFKVIYPEKKIYDLFRAQGISGEPFRPLIGQLPEMIKYRNNDEMFLYHEESTKKYGYYFLFGFGPLTRLICNEPDLLADVLSRNNAPNYEKPVDFISIFIPLVGRHSLLVAKGQDHERSRKMISPAFHHVNLKSMITIITDRASIAINGILKNEQKSKSVDLQYLFNELTLSIIISSAFGADIEANAHAKNVMCQIFAEVLDATELRSMRMINQIPFLSKLPIYKKDVIDSGLAKVGKFVDDIITDRRQGKSTSMCEGSDLLDLLLSAVDDEGEPFTDQEIKEQSLTFVLAGSETTGNLMTWLLYVLMTHEHVLQACREEVDRVLPKGTELTNEHLSQLVICEAIINETLRLYPPAPFYARHCVREHTIGSKKQIVVPKGATILINTHVIHRREDLWTRPLEFDYTRWLRDPATGFKSKLAHPFAYLPFASGPRNCIGQNFALLEARIMLAMFVQRCNFELIPGQKIVPDVKITMRPKYGLLATISQR